MNLRCAEAEDLLAAFAVDALTAAERLELLEHLAECRRHDAALAELHSVATRLPALVEQAPPPQARQRLLTAFDAAVAGIPTQSLATAPIGPAAARRGGIWTRLPNFSLTFGALVLAVAIVAGALILQPGHAVSPGSPVLTHESAQGDSSLRVVYLPDQQLVVLQGTLPPPPAGRVYQAWLIAGDQPLSLGLLDTKGNGAFTVDLTGISGVAVSLEPAGGSPQPTSTPLVVTPL